jgi:DNA-binding transcriptional ArsR family regulator
VITFQLSGEVLGRTRFAFSPLSEVALSLRLLGRPHVTHLHARWLQLTRGRLSGVDLPLLLAVVPPGKWIPSCLVPTAATTRVTIEDQLTDLTHLSPAQLTADLAQTWGERPRPPRLTELLDAGARGPGILAEALWEYWTAAIAPHWPRICGVLEADVAFRAGALAQRGLFALLDDLHAEATVQGHDLLVNKPHHASETYRATRLILTPCVFGYPSLVLEDGEPGVFGLTYPAHGVGRVWEGLEPPDHEADNPLAALFGRTRAAILERAAVPVTTTQMARELGQSPGSVSEHLTVLKANGLLSSRRAGRRVLYWQTPLAQSMISAQRTPATLRPGSISEALTGTRGPHRPQT